MPIALLLLLCAATPPELPDTSLIAASAASTADSAAVQPAEPAPPPKHGKAPPLVPFKDLDHAVRTFVSDYVIVATSPTRMHRHDALWLTGCVVTTGVLYAYDSEIANDFRRQQGNWFYETALKPGRTTFVRKIGDMGNTLDWYFLACGVGYATRFQPLREVTSEFLESHLISGGIRNTVGEVGRYRPFEGHGPRFFKFGRGTSFPSGHASSITELATILSHHAHSLPVSVALYAVAASSICERVDSRSHWPSDAFAGAATGLVISHFVVSMHDRRHAAIEGFAVPQGDGGRVGVMRRF
jgi:membrane-associated phospholipid phosphatase